MNWGKSVFRPRKLPIAVISAPLHGAGALT
jgi:hypothetical protein